MLRPQATAWAGMFTWTAPYQLHKMPYNANTKAQQLAALRIFYPPHPHPPQPAYLSIYLSVYLSVYLLWKPGFEPSTSRYRSKSVVITTLPCHLLDVRITRHWSLVTTTKKKKASQFLPHFACKVKTNCLRQCRYLLRCPVLHAWRQSRSIILLCLLSPYRGKRSSQSLVVF